jgi:hypothetical protein
MTVEEQANARRFIALCRETLKQRDTRPHFHGGPDPCPVCGGINPNLGGGIDREQASRIRATSDALLRIIDERDGRGPRKRYERRYAPWNAQSLEPLNIQRRA